MGSQQDTTDEATEPRHLSRRTVVRTGVTVAWAVPAIQVVAAAPALADSTDLSVGASGGWTSSTSSDATLTVTLGNTASATLLQVTVTSTSGSFKVDAQTNWTVDNGGFASSHTLTYTGTTTATGFTTTLHFKTRPSPSPKITVSATATNKHPGSGSYTP